MTVATDPVLASDRPVPIQLHTFTSPFGPLTVACSPRGVCFLAAKGDRDPWQELERRFPCRRASETADAERAARCLTEYFSSTDMRLNIDIDLRGLPAFQQRVLVALCGVGCGQWCSYADLAAKAGSPRAARAVGGAIGRNPIPILVPCHRVLAAGGGLGGFSWGLDRKRFLLSLERPAGTAWASDAARG